MSTQDSQSDELDKLIEQALVETQKRSTNRSSQFKNDTVDGLNRNDVRSTLRKAIEAYVTTRVKEAERLARIDEHTNWVLPATEQSHVYEQNENGSGIQYFDNERLSRLTHLKTLTTTTNGKAIR